MPHRSTPLIAAATTPWRAAGWAALGLCAVALGAFSGFRISERAGLTQLAAVTNERLELYATTLDAELRRCAFVPGLVAGEPDVVALLGHPGDAAVHERAARTLTRVGVRAGASLVVVADANGQILATSTGELPAPAAAQLTRLLRDGTSDFFAANEADGSTDFYYVLPVRRGGQTLGQVLVQLNLAPLEATWIDLGLRSQSERLLLVDEHEVAVLSSVPAWKFRRLDARLDAAASGRYAQAPLTLLALPVEREVAPGAALVRAPDPDDKGRDRPFLAQERPIVPLSARLVALADPAETWRQARYAAWGGGAAGALLALLGVYLAQRRRAVRQLMQAGQALRQAHDQLERQVDERTRELRAANTELTEQIAQRVQAEDELMQAGKLAVLGQMSAGISHEINQPLTALRALSRNAIRLLEAGRTADVSGNLHTIDDMAERMGRIVNQLKTFARKDSLQLHPVEIGRAVHNVMLMLSHRLHHDAVDIQVEVPEALRARADATRLEQVLLNLVGNALDALAGRSDAQLRLLGETRDGRVWLQVIDNGPGMPEAELERLFEPFHTTKPAGQGLGLGLVISSKIVRELGGNLRARPASPCGMVFEFDLPDCGDTDV